MWGEDKGLCWLTSDNNNKYLGFPINYKMAQKEKDFKVLQQVKGNITIWKFRKLTLTRKILIANYVILDSIWYIVHHVLICHCQP